MHLGSEARMRRGSRVLYAMFFYRCCEGSEGGRWGGCMDSFRPSGLPCLRLSLAEGYRGIRETNFRHDDAIEALGKELKEFGRGPKAICPLSSSASHFVG